MKRLILLRHAKSDWDPEGVSDFNRPLSSRGIREALASAHNLLKAGYRPDLIWSSPAIRAWHTAHLFAQVCSVPHAAVQPILGFYEGETSVLLDLVREIDPKWDTVLWVGHNPIWSMLATRWAGYSVELATSEACVLEASVEAWSGWPSGAVESAIYLKKP